MKKGKIENKILPATTITGVIILWEVLARLLQVPSYILPAPSRIITSTVEDSPLILGHLLTTLKECAIGFFVSVITAAVVSILMDLFGKLKKAVYPVLVMSQTIPTMALAPILIIWFGIGVLPKVIIIVLMCFFPIAISLTDGFEQVDPDYIRLFRAARASKFQEYIHLKIPSALPGFFSGLKISVTYMIMAAVIGEWLGGSDGIGVYMLREKNSFALDKMFGAILLVVILSIMLIYAVRVAGDRIIHWRRS